MALGVTGGWSAGPTVCEKSARLDTCLAGATVQPQALLPLQTLELHQGAQLLQVALSSLAGVGGEYQQEVVYF